MNLTAKELNADHFGQVLTIRTIGEIGFDQLNLVPVTIEGILTGIHSSADYITDDRLCSAETTLQPTKKWVELDLWNPTKGNSPETYSLRLEVDAQVTIQEGQ